MGRLEHFARGNMKRKLLAAREALEGGAGAVVIADSRAPSPVRIGPVRRRNPAVSGIYGSRGLTVVSGAGAAVRDDRGREYLDFYCGSGAALFGHCHPVLVEALRKAAESPWTVGPGMGSPARDAFRQRISEETARSCRLLLQQRHRIGGGGPQLALSLRPDRKKVLALRRAFHGRTLGALSLTFNPSTEGLDPYSRPVTHVMPGELPARWTGTQRPSSWSPSRERAVSILSPPDWAPG